MIEAPPLHNHPLNKSGHEVQEEISFTNRHRRQAASSLALAVLTLGSWYFITQKAPEISPVQANTNTFVDNPVQPGADNLLVPDTNIYPGVLATQTNTPASTPTETSIPTATMETFVSGYHSNKKDEGTSPEKETATSTPTKTATAKPQPSTTSTPTSLPKREAQEQRTTKITISNAILWDTSNLANERKSSANALVKMAEETLKETGLGGLVTNIDIVAPENARLTVEQVGYGKDIDASMARGELLARFFPKESLIVLSNSPGLTLPTSKDVFIHELSHALNKRYEVLDSLLSLQEKKELEGKYEKAFKEYDQKAFVEGHPYYDWDRKIQNGLFAEIGQQLKASFVNSIGHPEYLNMGVPRETLEQAAKTQKDPVILLMINNFLKDPTNPFSTNYLIDEGLGREIVRVYCLKGADFLNLPPQLKTKLLDNIERTILGSRTEWLAEFSKDVIRNKKGLETEYPNSYAAVQYAFQTARAKLSN